MWRCAQLRQRWIWRSGRTCLGASRPSSPPGTQFTCFTSTKVHILTPEGCSFSSNTAQSSSSSSSSSSAAPRGLVPLLLASLRLSGTRSAPASASQQHTSAYVSIRPHTSASQQPASASQQHTSAYVSIPPHTSASQQPASASQQHSQRAREEEEEPPTRTTHPRAPSALWRACVQLLVHSLLAYLLAFPCFTGTTGRILTRQKAVCYARCAWSAATLLSLLALLVQKYKY